MKISSKRITYFAMLLACSVILPQLFHLSGLPGSGEIFLPMHIPVLLGGFVLGPLCGTLVGLFSPIVSSIITGMPAPARLPFMIAELAAYGFAGGFMYHKLGFDRKKFGIYISLIIAMLFGRAVYTLAAVIAGAAFDFYAGGIMAAVNSSMKGISGIILQIMFVPPIVYSLKKAGMTVEQ